ncbi:MAG: hypothetical protein JSU01_18470 [Bacteroidetes bacterium]|nr:hypothetical protein [Bacteroidota bacterium]
MKYLPMIAALLISLSSTAQQKTSGFTVVNRTLSVDGNAIHLDERENEGVAWVNDKEFTSGVIDVDIKGRDVLQQSFVGIAFHGVNDSSFEVIYFRPFNFRASDTERKVHAVQYVAEPKYDWQYLRTNFHNQYEKAVDPAPNANDWFHARIEVHGDIVSVFVNGNETASLIVRELVNTGGKKIGFWAGNNSDGNWKNLKITSTGN